MLNRPEAVDEIWICIYDPETKEKSTEWIHSANPESKEVQDKEVIEHGTGVCLLGLTEDVACRLPGKGCNHHGKVLRCTSRQLNQLQTSR
jgi:hypothetical protein